MLQYECLATLWHIGDLRPRCGVVCARSPAVGGVRVAGESGKVPCDIHGDFPCRVCHNCQSGGLQSSSGIGSSSHGSMTSWPRSKMPDTATDSSTGGPVLGAMIDRKSLFQCRERAPDKSTVKRWFRSFKINEPIDRTSLFERRRRASRAHVLGKCARNSAAFWRMTVFRFYARPLWSRDRFALAIPSHRRCGSAFMHTLITSRPRTHATINRATACCAG